MASKRLSQVETKEVSFVDRGAVRKKFALFKRGPMDEKILKAALDTPLDNEADLDTALEKAGIEAEPGQAVKAALRVIASASDQMTDVQKAVFFTKAFPPPKKGDEPADEDKPADDKDDKDPKKTKTSKAADATAPAAAGVPVTVAVEKAAIAPEVQAQFETLTKANSELLAKQEKLEKANAELLEKADAKECLEKATSEFPLVGAPAEVGAFIHRLKKAGCWDEKAEQILKGAQEKAKQANLFSVKGSSARGPEAGGAEAQLQKAAQAIADAKKISLAKAYDEALQANPDLYTQAQAEHKAALK